MANISIPTTINLPDDWKEQILERVKHDGDWVLVTRCEDCENWQTDWNPSIPDRHYCAVMDSMMKANDFCSYGEMREDTSNG